MFDLIPKQFPDNFVEGLQSRFFGERFRGATLSRITLPHGFSEKIAAWIQSRVASLVVLGPPGVGKTYLCAALFELIPRAFTTYRCYTERHLLERLRQGISSGLNGDYLSHLHDLVDDELFILDDIGSSGQGQTAWREEILMEVLDHRYKHKSASVYTSNLTRVDFEMQYHLRISSRLFAAENFILDMASMPDQRALGK